MAFVKRLMNPYKGLPREIYIIFVSRIINSMGTFVFPLLLLILTQKIGFTKAQSGIFVAFQGLGALCYIFCGLIKPSITMAIFIIFASCFYGMASTAFEAVTADLTTTKNRKESFSLLYMGPVVMSIVVTYYGYYISWIIISLLVLIAVIFMYVLSRKNRVEKTKVNI